MDAFHFSFINLQVVPVPFFPLSSSSGSLTENNMSFYFTLSFLPLLLAHNCQTRFIILFPCVLRRTASQFPPGLTSQLTLEPCAEK